MRRDINERFAEDGFIVIRNLLAPDEVAAYIARLKALAQGKDRWTQPDGVNRNRDFWPIIFHERLIAAVRGLLGPDIRYLPHNDLHFGFSSFSWHRDSVNRDTGVGPDWDEEEDPYRIVRCGLYLQRFDESQFKLGLIKGSHRPIANFTDEEQRRVQRKTGAMRNVLSGLSGMDFVGDDAEWVATEPGDCVIFDPRILHTGSKIHGAKYSIFLAYGVENSHFRNHWHYYLNLRKDLGYAGLDPALAEELRAANLLASPPPADLEIEGAWIPSSTFTYVAKKFK
jgi:hypothetical protein